jgi:hypothetical protein
MVKIRKACSAWLLRLSGGGIIRGGHSVPGLSRERERSMYVQHLRTTVAVLEVSTMGT